MTRYIDAEALMKAIRRGGDFTRADLLYILDDIPTADVVEVRHGTWYHGTENGSVYAKCSACGRKMNYSCYGYAYCSLCGAKMDGRREK